MRLALSVSSSGMYTSPLTEDLQFSETKFDGTLQYARNKRVQTPNPPIAAGGGRKTNKRVVLVCHGATQSNNEVIFPNMGYEPMNMLGIIQSQKTAELLLDLKVSCMLTSPRIASVDTAMAISEVQEAADFLVADCIPPYVEIKKCSTLKLNINGANGTDCNSIRNGADDCVENLLGNICNINQFLRDKPEVELKFCPRDINFLANALAKHAMSNPGLSLLHRGSERPRWLEDLLVAAGLHFT